MTRYVFTRIVQGLVVVFGAITITFVMAAIAGNPVDAKFNGLPPEIRARLVHQLGYDRPIPARFVAYLADVVHGSFGPSLSSPRSPLALVAAGLPYTLVLVLGAMLLACSVAVPCAVFGAIHRQSRLDTWIRRVLMVLQGLPEFFIGLLLVLIFAVALDWLPSFGIAGPASYVLPIVALSLPLMSTLTRLLRAQLLDILGMDFVIAMRAKGLSERDIVLRHGMRNAGPPMITYLALQLGWLLGGTIFVEVVFGIPGIGSLIVLATRSQDIAVVQAVVVTVAVGYVLLNLLADLAVYAVDPRVRSAR